MPTTIDNLSGGTSLDYQGLPDAPASVIVLTPSEIFAQIAILESKQARPLREFALSGQWDTEALARVKEIDVKIAELRSQL